MPDKVGTESFGRYLLSFLSCRENMERVMYDPLPACAVKLAPRSGIWPNFGQTRPAGGGGRFCRPLPNPRTGGRSEAGDSKRKLSMKT